MTTTITPLFRCEHPRTPENTASNGSLPPRCRTCRNAQVSRRRRANRENTCINGHPWTEVSTERRMSHGKLVRRCRICRQHQERSDTIILPGTAPQSIVADRGVIENAACAGADLTDFFPAEGEQGIPERACRAARVYCARCPMRQRCGDQATAARDQGLWGGAWRSVDSAFKNRYRITLLVEESVIQDRRSA
ncbi:WhiB family transcriptional regulator [Saccharopolyspora taberi]|uniref:4Fe-4S Wbl-type domain-containing protein n=1 Tax=Saccharopolyspora taberi TaxID=60895 RepID=A0ABN3V0E4_9PSEU